MQRFLEEAQAQIDAYVYETGRTDVLYHSDKVAATGSLSSPAG